MRPRSYWLVIHILVLGLLSILTLRGISVTYATNQLFFFIIGLLTYYTLSSFPFSVWKQSRWLWYTGVIGLLVITLIIGNATKGAVSWLRIGSYRLQPSELAKPALLLLLASNIPLASINKLKSFGQFSFWALLPMVLILLQPDLGTLITLVAGVGVMFLQHRPHKKLLIMILSLVIVVSISGWFFWLQDYQKDRLRSFWQPQTDVQDSGYNARQAMIAVGSGGFTGLGWGEGRQSHLRFLPEQQTDFLFATYAEERGFIGSLILITIYGSLFFTLSKISQQIREPSAWLFAISSSSLLLVQSFINLGMNIGLTPVTGVPLPLFSLGGSSLISTTIILGWIESARRSQLIKNHSL